MPPERAILGIDPAWTATEPSGVALLAESGTGWRCIAVAPSYDSFYALANGEEVEWTRPGAFPAAIPNVEALVTAARKLLRDEHIEVVTVDMPIATVPFTTRRSADQEISRTFGRNKCAAHSPNAARPGAIGRAISEGFHRQGFAVGTKVTPVGTQHMLLEVYPHTALLRLLGLEERLPYKVGKSSKYWPGVGLDVRRGHLLDGFRQVIDALSEHIADINLPLPQLEDVVTSSALKRYEDAIDALVCAWVGICYLNGSAVPYGDDTAAIWVPTAAVV